MHCFPISRKKIKANKLLKTRSILNLHETINKRIKDKISNFESLTITPKIKGIVTTARMK